MLVVVGICNESGGASRDSLVGFETRNEKNLQVRHIIGILRRFYLKLCDFFATVNPPYATTNEVATNASEIDIYRVQSFIRESI